MFQQNANSTPFWVRREAADMLHVGSLNVPIGGRTDHIPVSVPSGSYVMPADVVSGLGEGNTLRGNAMLDARFKQGPYGSFLPHLGRGPGPPRPPHPYSPAGIGHNSRMFAEGGAVSGSDQPLGSHPGWQKPAKVLLAGGEYVVAPERCEDFGGGDIDHGHASLDAFVKLRRSKVIDTLKKLPGPKKD